MQVSSSSAIVTGGGSGLGAATAKMLAAAGASVVLLDLPSSRGSEVAAELGDHVVFVAGDVTDEASVQAAVDAASQLAPLRVAVNCAGVADAGRTVGREGPIALAHFDKVIRINLLGTFNVTRLAAAAMMANEPVGVGVGETPERGVIVNTASVAAFDGQIGQAAYSASKGGVHAMTLPLAREFAKSLIRVVTIAPGIFETPMVMGMPQEVQDSLGAQVPHPSRLGRPAEYASLVEHIISNSMINGETIRLDGAIRMTAK